MNTKSYLVHAKRTPIGKLGGKLSHVRPDDLLAELIKDFTKTFDFDFTKIDDVIVGCANQAGEDNRNIARMSSILGGLPYEVPGTTINRLCGSSLDALLIAHAKIQANMGQAFLIGGVESMTRSPYVISKSTGPFGRDSKLYDSTFGWRFENPKMKEMFPLYGMGQTAEEVASLHNISRVDQDEFAIASHKKSINAIQSGKFKDEILAIEVKHKKLNYIMDQDEGPRDDTNLEKLSKLKPVFKKGGSVTAGNSSMMNDGAALLFLVNEQFLKDHNLTPILEFSHGTVAGLHPNVMGLGPIEATKKLLSQSKEKISEYDLVELNEAFAVQSLACIRELGIDPNIVNLNGGAISLGHPLGCSGARIVTTLFHLMKNDQKLKNGLATMCIGVGQGIAASFRNCI